MPSNTLSYYLQQVQRRARIHISPSFPTGTPSNEEQDVLDCINRVLRLLNNKYYLLFQQSTFTFNTIAGQTRYNLKNAPYNLTDFRLGRLARNPVVRQSDGYPIEYIDYTELDLLRGGNSTSTLPNYYSAYGDDLILYPGTSSPVSLQLRYYSLSIGTNSTGTVQKTRLTLESDIPMLEDEWEDALIVGAAKEYRMGRSTDGIYAELKQQFDEYELMFIDMQNQVGEDNGPQIEMPRYIFNERPGLRRYFPFGTRYE